MSKKVTIPTDGGNPFVVILGGIKYVYKPGETVEVPDGVALEIEEWERWRDKYRGAVQPPFAAGGDVPAPVQSDLSQNDPAAADYVKNRTHWVEEAIILSETVVEINDGEGVIGPPFTVNVGEKYVVTYNGVDYETQAKIINGFICLGNGSVFDSSVENTEEPFIIAVVNSSVMLVDLSGVTSATLSIKGDCYHTLKGAYLPTATENFVGGVRFGEGETMAARVVNIYFDATKEEFEHARHLSREFGAVLKIAGDIVSYGSGDFESDTGLRCKLLREEPSLVIARLDSEGNFTMKREYDTGRIIRSSGGKYFEINVDDNGTISAIEISNPY